MGVDVLKKLKGEAKARQAREERRHRSGGGGAGPGAAETKDAKKFEPGGALFVSNNWRKLLDSRPKIAPKTAAAAAAPAAADGGASDSVVALDCEMVGVGPAGTRSALARVSIVDHEGRILIDRFVRPSEKITDYRSKITGITAATLEGPGVLSEREAREKAAALLKDKIVVGHSVHFDFEVLLLSHPHVLIRDTAMFRPLRPQGQERKTPSLAKLCQHWLHQDIHTGSHDSVEDARIALRLYRLKSRLWEKQLRSAMSHHALPVGGGAGNVAADSDEEGERVERAGSAAAKSASGSVAGGASGTGRAAGAPAAAPASGNANKGKKARARDKRLLAAEAAASAAAAKAEAKAKAKAQVPRPVAEAASARPDRKGDVAAAAAPAPKGARRKQRAATEERGGGSGRAAPSAPQETPAAAVRAARGTKRKRSAAR
eukprot:TRINITY_DN29080_c0_g1_i3.p2 TRINITY_DN29080_c0_g1~~TRINITY_DN29080_c0_g1_i3.p2  ORF type:complete len:432 (-),score=130.88 TRINITY_DN29080_c0_g1_i3:10-1305(-)